MPRCDSEPTSKPVQPREMHILRPGPIFQEREQFQRARDVGIAMARNRFAPFVPCHRVVAANGKLGGYSAPGGMATKRRLLEIEGVRLLPDEPLQTALFDQL